jgi:hypothetical protein
MSSPTPYSPTPSGELARRDEGVIGALDMPTRCCPSGDSRWQAARQRALRLAVGAHARGDRTAIRVAHWLRTDAGQGCGGYVPILKPGGGPGPTGRAPLDQMMVCRATERWRLCGRRLSGSRCAWLRSVPVPQHLHYAFSAVGSAALPTACGRYVLAAASADDPRRRRASDGPLRVLPLYSPY